MKNQPPFRVFVIEDDPYYNTMLTRTTEMALSPYATTRKSVVRSFRSLEAACALLSLKPDLILLDFFLDSDPNSENNAQQVLDLLVKEADHPKIMLLSSTREVVSMDRFFYQFGVSACVLKDDQALAHVQEFVAAHASGKRVAKA